MWTPSAYVVVGPTRRHPAVPSVHHAPTAMPSAHTSGKKSIKKAEPPPPDHRPAEPTTSPTEAMVREATASTGHGKVKDEHGQAQRGRTARPRARELAGDHRGEETSAATKSSGLLLESSSE